MCCMLLSAIFCMTRGLQPGRLVQSASAFSPCYRVHRKSNVPLITTDM
ncbi:BnaC08g09630D [Brassica napus]|uniref:BnaC08g09630D protein n=1 Tax=Brassica napus TaxID=3708 RepID=A0A078HHM1_BRANA|nr:BnaC08g09630D [Brassica napus]